MTSISSSQDTEGMHKISHTIDPDGEVTIVLQNANAPFAVWPEATATDSVSGARQPQSQAETTVANNNTEEKEIRYKVSAKHLTLASTVFAKALSTKWNEGSTLRDKGSVEVIADGWDSEALLILLNIFHCRFNDLPRQIDMDLLAKITVLADYYQCIPVINIFVDMWITAIKPHFPETYGRSLLLWLLVCSLFNLTIDCETLGQIAIKQSPGLIPTLGLPFPGSMIVDLNMKRETVIGHILDTLHAKVNHMSRHNDDGYFGIDCYDCTTFKLGALLKLMIALSVSPKPFLPYHGLNYEGLVDLITSDRGRERRCRYCVTFPRYLVKLRAHLQSESEDIIFA